MNMLLLILQAKITFNMRCHR